MKKFINLLLISFILLSLTAVTGANAAGGTTFSIDGKVLDRLGNPIPGADVTLIDWNFNTIRSMKTTDTGNFDFLNVVADTDTCTVKISYTDSDGKKYESPSPYNRAKWYPTKGMQFVLEKETVILNYPPPIYGYIYGAIQTDMSTSGQFINGIVYLESLDNGVKYYIVADRTDGKGSFQFYAPAGPYMLYAQHWENGVVYQSSLKQVTIKPNTDALEVLETRIILPLNSPANDPDPSMMPEHYNNKVNGSVLTKDGKPWPGATVTLLQKADNGTGFLPMKGSDSKPRTTTTDTNGNYEFYGVSPTSDDGKSIQSKKDVKVMVEYTDASGNKQAITAESRDARPMYYPDMIMGYGAENAARIISLPPVTLPFAKGGWVSLSSVPTGAFIYVDDQQLFGPNNQPLITPCTAYIDPGDHSIKMVKEGYTDSVDSITMVANTEHPEFIMSLQKAIVPPWVTAAVAVIILLIVVVLIVVLLATRIKLLLAPFGRIFGGFGHKWSDYRANRDISRAHKAEVAEQKSLERQRMAEEKMAVRRESISPAGGQARDDVPIVNVDSVRRKHDAGAADEGKKTFGGSKKKILDIDLKHIADSVPKKIKPKEEAKKERTPVVFANEIYKKANTDIERIPYESSTPRQSVSEREALVERPTTPERGDRFRIPRTSGQREANSPGDRERVLKYIREHPEGVSFIQMSNDLEIIPNNLTYITKELVINDDIEKVKGLYYYKSHASPAEDSSSSVVVWRLDGDK
jgi:protocatechuate 3,4-dioxygenase beta subunit